MPGRGDGTFDDGVRFETSPPAPALLTADLDGDGREDIATLER